MNDKVVLVTGAARRVGAGIARYLHGRGCKLVLHYRGSRSEAEALACELASARPGSVCLVQADLTAQGAPERLIAEAVAAFGRLDALVNNASSFYPTELGAIGETDWDDLIGSNLKVPLFLAQAAAPHLAASGGAIVGIVDIHAERPMAKHLVYSVAKAGHAQLIRALALELAPRVRVNGVSPGVNLWPDNEVSFDTAERERIEASIPLARTGGPDDIARAVAFLLLDTGYVTGQILAVDGGRSVVL